MRARTFTFECQDGHFTERELDDAGYDALEFDSEGHRTVACECGKDAIRLYTSAHVVYNAKGFYGAVPTAEAHAVGLV